MIKSFTIITCLIILSFNTTRVSAQTELPINEVSLNADLSDRLAILKTIKDFYIGDHTGSIKHKKLSMHDKGAYRYINRAGEYKESIFKLDSDDSDPNYKEELLSIEIYDKMALVKLRLDQFQSEVPEYKLMLLHKANGLWKITTITWGFGITQ